MSVCFTRISQIFLWEIRLDLLFVMLYENGI